MTAIISSPYKIDPCPECVVTSIKSENVCVPIMKSLTTWLIDDPVSPISLASDYQICNTLGPCGHVEAWLVNLRREHLQ